jgi:tRNA (cytidine/uridine-2'-O-)-methyltransferase
MKQGHPQICLYQPEIPQNTGNIGRLAAATACRLHLVKPFGFATDDRNLRRPGLDYWPFLDLEIHDDIESLFSRFQGRLAFFSKTADKYYTDLPPTTDLLIFGRETQGLPDAWRTRFAEDFYRIPMFHEGVRSLNLANAVSVVLYDQLRQRQNF